MPDPQRGKRSMRTPASIMGISRWKPYWKCSSARRIPIPWSCAWDVPRWPNRISYTPFAAATMMASRTGAGSTCTMATNRTWMRDRRRSQLCKLFRPSVWILAVINHCIYFKLYLGINKAKLAYLRSLPFPTKKTHFISFCMFFIYFSFFCRICFINSFFAFLENFIIIKHV